MYTCMDLQEYFRDLHVRELERRDSFQDGLTFSIGLMGAVGTGVVGLATNLAPPMDSLDYISTLLLLCCSVLLLFASYHIWRGTVVWKYHYPAYPAELHQYYSELDEWAKQQGISTEDEFAGSMILEWVRCSDSNAKINDKRSAHHYGSKRFLLLSLAPLGAASLLPILKPFIL